MEAVGQADFQSQDLYKNLGVARDSSNAQIKKAYKKLSLKHHPDKNPDNKEQAEEIFKKISYAYGILGDEKKRKDYDAYGREFFEQGGRSGGGGGGAGFQRGGFSSAHFNMRNADDIFKEFFGGKDPFASFFDDDDDFFGGGFGGMRGGMMGGSLFDEHFGGGGFGRQQTQQPRSSQQQQQARRRDPFAGFGMSMMDDDDFFGGGFGGGGGLNRGFTSFQSSSFGGFGGGGMGESIQQQTIIENGVQKTVTKKTTIDQNGNRQTEVIEESQDPRTGEIQQIQYIENGQARSGGGGHKAIKGGSKKSRK